MTANSSAATCACAISISDVLIDTVTLSELRSVSAIRRSRVVHDRSAPQRHRQRRHPRSHDRGHGAGNGRAPPARAPGAEEQMRALAVTSGRKSSWVACHGSPSRSSGIGDLGRRWERQRSGPGRAVIAPLFQLSSEASEGITGRVHRTREGTETECGLCSNFLAVIANHEKHSPKKRVWCLSSLGISLMTRSYL
jgi:hypothetical protein